MTEEEERRRKIFIMNLNNQILQRRRSASVTVNAVDGGAQSQSFSDEYQAVLDQATADGVELPSAEQKAIDNQKIVDMIAGGQWSEIDVYYNFATTTSDGLFGLYNWKDPASYKGIKIGTPRFTSGVGWDRNATNSFIHIPWNPRTNGVNYTQNDSGMGCYTSSDSKIARLGAGCLYGSNDGTINLLFYYTSNTWQIRLNASSDYNTTSRTLTKRYQHTTRNGTALSVQIGDTVHSTTQASSTVVNNTIGVLARKTSSSSTSADQYMDGYVSQFWAGSKDCVTGLKAILDAYNEAVHPTVPSTATLVAQYDFNDSTKIWADTGKTVPITAGTAIRATENIVTGNSWADLTSADAGTSPIWRSAVQNSKNAAEWDGVDDNFNFSKPSLPSQCAIILVLKNDDAALGSHPLKGTNYIPVTGSTYPPNSSFGNLPYWVVHPNGGTGVNGPNLKNTADGWNVIGFIKNGNEYRLFNGHGIRTIATDTNPFDFSKMGEEFNVGWWMDGYIGLMEVYEGTRYDNEMEDRIFALNTAYAL